MHSSKTFFIIGAILVAVTFTTTTAANWDASDDLFMGYMTALKHGDNCSYEAEELRQNWTSTIMDTSTYRKLQAIQNWKSVVLSRRENFCSAVNLLVCSRKNVCVCGDPGKKAFGFVDVPSNYTQETVNNQVKCRWSVNSACVDAQDMPMPAQMKQFMDSRCATGTTCKTRSGSSRCTMMSLVLHAIFIGIRSERRLAEDIFGGVVCTCQADQSENEIDSNAGYNRLAYRTKRDVQSQFHADEDDSYLMASFGGIPSASSAY